jgi:tetratricopeptide (TPR) repeat protein/DNA-binding SARP family transcriptional activator/DNA-binding XRE family transcriptional regulator
MDGRRDTSGARLGAIVREFRRAAGLTQRQLADRSGLSVAAVRDLEQGRRYRPRPGSLDALARALGLDAGQSATLGSAARATRPARLAPAGTGAPAGHGSGLWLAVLGPLAAWRDGRPLELGPPQRATVLMQLALQPGELVRRETIIDTLWGHQPPSTAAELVQAHVSRLRRILDPGGRERLLEHSPAGYRLRTGTDELDVMAFTELAGRAGKAAAAGDRAAACELYAQALELWRGEPAADAQVLRGHPAVTGLARRRTDAVLGYADAACELGWHQRVLPLLEALAQELPLEERVNARLMVALAGAGQQAAAIEVFEGLRRRLDEELGVRPGAELTAAHQRVLRQDIPAEAVTSTPDKHGGPVSTPGVVYSLPPDTAVFTGRQAELDRITATVTTAAASGGVVAIHAIGGMPGVGKTALAVHAAHVLTDQFPDRQLFISLHAHTPGQSPVTPEAALAGLLAAVGVDARYLPPDLAGRTALWRDRMAGQKALLVLDNAASSAQVTPLLLGGDGCLVLVTSRRHLGDLPGAAASVLLPVLAAAEAQDMFVRLAPRAADGPAGTIAELAELAGFLPLAISLLARVYARHPSWTLADLAAETRAGLLTLAAERDSVAAAFAVSYRYLDPARQQFFRFLGLHPGTTIDSYAAAALAGLPVSEAAGQLDALHAEGLLTEAGRRRYSMHDLIRRYARDLAATDPPATREQALERLLDYYQYTAAQSERLLADQARPGPDAAPQLVPAAIPDLTDSTQALTWARTERVNLLACLDHATATGQHARIIALTAGTASLLRHDGPWTTAITRHTTAITVARHLGDRLGQANALTDLAEVQRLAGDYGGAVEALEESLDISRDVGNRIGHVGALTGLGAVRLLTGDYGRAVDALEEALGISRDTGNRIGQARALTYLGDVRMLTGDYGGAVEALEEALGIFRDIGNRTDQARALTYLGAVRRMAGDYRAAAEALKEALSISREVGNRMRQAGALTGLGVVRRMAGDYGGAVEALEEALGISRDIGNRTDQAGALTYLGAVRRMTGDYAGAANALEEALGIYRDTGDRGGEAETLNEAGTVHRLRGDPGKAEQYHRQALDLAREITSPWDEAHALAGLGRCALADGRAADAAAALRQARDIFQRIGAPETTDVAAELESLTGPGPAA